MDLGLDGKRALVLGGTRGLGLACARALAEAGAQVLVNGRSDAGWEEARAGLRDAKFFRADVGIEADRRALCAAADQFGPISIVVTNAGGPPVGRFEELSSSQWRSAFETNVLAMIEIVRHFLPQMKARGYGRIINVTSFVVRELYPNMSLSNGLRVALTGAMGSMAREVAAFGVTVNGMLPGLMDTGALQRVIRDRAQRDGTSEAAVRAAMAASVPSQRLGEAADFGPLCAFLASPLASYITGQNICVDGGLTKNVI